jgi:hypothetical protein
LLIFVFIFFSIWDPSYLASTLADLKKVQHILEKEIPNAGADYGDQREGPEGKGGHHPQLLV